MRTRRLIAAGLLTAAAFSTTVGAFAITGSLNKAFAASPVSPPVSGPQNPGQMGQNGNQSGTGQNPGQEGQNAAPLSVADLAGSISGSVAVGGSNLCTLFYGSSSVVALFSATYSKSAVGPATLYSGGCVTDGLYSGVYFTIATRVGTFHGNVTGQIHFAALPPTLGGTIAPISAELTVTAISGTGLFTGTTGTLDIALTFPTFGSYDFTGTVTAA